MRLVAELSNGQTEEIVVHQPKGHPDAPLSDVDLLEKMTWLLEGLASAPHSHAALDLSAASLYSEDVQQLVDTCSVTPTMRALSSGLEILTQ